MSSYYKETYAIGAENRRRPTSGDARKGVIPQPETPAEKVRRLRERGYGRPLAEPIDFDTNGANLFANYDLGNKELPAYRHKTEIIDALSNNRIILLTGPTGSGKTTQLAQYALEAGFDRVVYLQPRRINADNTGKRIEEELISQLGDAMPDNLVGIAHSERSTHTEESRVLSVTSATFTKMLSELSTRWADERVLVVPDETHENGLDTEFASAVAVRQAERDGNWRVAFSSATPDGKVLKESYEMINGGPIPVIEIQGRPFGIEMIDAPNDDAVDAYFHYGAGVQKSMIFVEGKRRINEVISEMKKRMTPEENRITRFFKLHAEISERAKQEIFNMNLRPGEKAVIVSTSAGQSGITIPGLQLVIASGITKSPELDTENAEGLPTRHCTQAEIIQQAGRSGRDIDGGKCVLARPIGFRKYKNQHNDLYRFIPLDERDPDMPPEIYHSNISRNVLTATAMGEDFRELNTYLKHSVTVSTICDAYDVLDKLGAVSDDNPEGREMITDIGQIMDVYPLRPELSRAIAETYNTNTGLHIQAYALLIAAAIEAGGLIDHDDRQSLWKQSIRPSTDDDFIAQLDMMLATREYSSGTDADEKYLMQQGFSHRRVYRAHRQFSKMCRLVGLDPRDIDMPEPTPDEEDELRGLFLVGMPDLIYRRESIKRGVAEYANVWGGLDSAIPREISNRSLLASIGSATLKIVAGYPRWYIKDDGEVKNIIEMGFPVSMAHIRERLGHLACGSLMPEIRGNRLVKTGEVRLGAMSLGDAKVKNRPAEDAEDVRLLVDALMRGDKCLARQALHERGMPGADIREHASRLAYGAYTVRELDARLWQVVAELERGAV